MQTNRTTKPSLCITIVFVIIIIILLWLLGLSLILLINMIFNPNENRIIIAILYDHFINPLINSVIGPIINYLYKILTFILQQNVVNDKLDNLLKIVDKMSMQIPLMNITNMNTTIMQIDTTLQCMNTTVMKPIDINDIINVLINEFSASVLNYFRLFVITIICILIIRDLKQCCYYKPKGIKRDNANLQHIWRYGIGLSNVNCIEVYERDDFKYYHYEIEYMCNIIVIYVSKYFNDNDWNNESMTAQFMKDVLMKCYSKYLISFKFMLYIISILIVVCNSHWILYLIPVVCMVIYNFYIFDFMHTLVWEWCIKYGDLISMEKNNKKMQNTIDQLSKNNYDLSKTIEEKINLDTIFADISKKLDLYKNTTKIEKIDAIEKIQFSMSDEDKKNVLKKVGEINDKPKIDFINSMIDDLVKIFNSKIWKERLLYGRLLRGKIIELEEDPNFLTK